MMALLVFQGATGEIMDIRTTQSEPCQRVGVSDSDVPVEPAQAVRQPPSSAAPKDVHAANVSLTIDGQLVEAGYGHGV
jgi:hypothetical protein